MQNCYNSFQRDKNPKISFFIQIDQLSIKLPCFDIFKQANPTHFGVGRVNLVKGGGYKLYEQIIDVI